MTGSGKPTNHSVRLQVLHDSDTPLGSVMLRKRWSLALERDVFEMTINGKLMMSSAVVESEQALAQRALALLPPQDLRILIGGLGFGFTAQATLQDTRVRKVTVVERLELVIEWHRNNLLPWSAGFYADPRLKVVLGDFFAVVAQATQSRYHAILIDIDDSPNLLWHGSHAAFYSTTGLQAVQRKLLPQGVLAIWCATHPGEPFLAAAAATFAWTNLVAIDFENPSLRQAETNYILLAQNSR